MGLAVRDGSSGDDVGDGNGADHVAHKLTLAPIGMQGEHGLGMGKGFYAGILWARESEMWGWR